MKPAIIGLGGPGLHGDEAGLLETFQPAGIILFARNIETPAQLAALIAGIRRILPAALVMVDQEGGRVARLRPPHWRAHPPARAHPHPRAAWLTGALIGLECQALGIDLVAAPVLDVASPDGHAVIGDRAFSDDPARVAEMGQAMAAGLLAAGVQPIGKHAPGHGRARADSHLTLPTLDDIADGDLIPFRQNAGLPWLMTAHIRYTSRDMENPATQSAAIIADIIRAPGGIGFAGALITDDLAMHALQGPPAGRALRALAAGCDVALHCSGVLAESAAILRAIPPAGPATRARLAAARKMAQAARMPLDAAALVAERAALLA